MDISNIQQTLLKGLEQKNTDQLIALSRVLNLIVGKTLIANVTATQPVTAQERAVLLQQTNAALTQLNKQVAITPTPVLKAEIARLTQQQQLVQSPQLKWVDLAVNNRPIVTYSDRPLTPGQNVAIQLQSPQKLVLLNDSVTTEPNSSAISDAADNKTLAPDTAAQNATGKTVTPSTQPSIAASSIEKLLASIPNNTTSVESNNALTANVATGSTSNSTISATNTPNKSPASIEKNLAAYTNELIQKLTPDNADKTQRSRTNAQQVVSENLRNLLPRQDQPNNLLAAITLFQQLPTASRLQLLSPTLEQTLKSLAEQLRSPEQLSTPNLLAQSLKNSGVFFENKLSHIAQPQSDAKKSSPNNQIDTQDTSTRREKTSTENQSPNENKQPENKQLLDKQGLEKLIARHAVAQTYSQDLKGSLLTLLQKVTQALTGTSKPLTNDQVLKLLQQFSQTTGFDQATNATTGKDKTEVQVDLGTFIQQLLNKPVKELSNKELRTQLLVLLQQHTLNSLAKIQLQQLHSLNHELENQDSTQTKASWQLEIPVKYHQDIHHIQLHITREWIDEKHTPERGKSYAKIKQWSVTLRFDLPTSGEFCAQLNVINTQVSATLWAAQEKTFAQTQKQMDGLRKQLENEGIQVNSLQCMRGIPPKKNLALSYSLIDIST